MHIRTLCAAAGVIVSLLGGCASNRPTVEVVGPGTPTAVNDTRGAYVRTWASLTGLLRQELQAILKLLASHPDYADPESSIHAEISLYRSLDRRISEINSRVAAGGEVPQAELETLKALAQVLDMRIQLLVTERFPREEQATAMNSLIDRRLPDWEPLPERATERGLDHAIGAAVEYALVAQELSKTFKLPEPGVPVEPRDLSTADTWELRREEMKLVLGLLFVDQVLLAEGRLSPGRLRAGQEIGYWTRAAHTYAVLELEGDIARRYVQSLSRENQDAVRGENRLDPSGFAQFAGWWNERVQPVPPEQMQILVPAWRRMREVLVPRNNSGGALNHPVTERHREIMLALQQQASAAPQPGAGG